MSHQNCQIIGRLGADPEMHYVATGQPVISFSVATNRKYTNGNSQEVKEVAWFKVSAWGKLAEVCNLYLKKGSQVYVEGRLIVDPGTGGPRIWTKQDGNPAANFEINANLIRFLGGKNDNGNGQVEAPATPAESEIPF